MKNHKISSNLWKCKIQNHFCVTVRIVEVFLLHDTHTLSTSILSWWEQRQQQQWTQAFFVSRLHCLIPVLQSVRWVVQVCSFQVFPNIVHCFEHFDVQKKKRTKTEFNVSVFPHRDVIYRSLCQPLCCGCTCEYLCIYEHVNGEEWTANKDQVMDNME